MFYHCALGFLLVVTRRPLSTTASHVDPTLDGDLLLLLSVVSTRFKVCTKTSVRELLRIAVHLQESQSAAVVIACPTSVRSFAPAGHCWCKMSVFSGRPF